MAARGISAVRHGGAVRISMPAKVANDLGQLQQVFVQLADRFGHSACYTGCDVLFAHTIRELHVREDLNVVPLVELPGGASLPSDPIPVLPSDPVPAKARSATVPIAINDEINSNIDRLVESVGLVANRLGCGDCHSGFDVLYHRQLDLIGFDKAMNVFGFGRFA
jgi:hypothetical protein